MHELMHDLSDRVAIGVVEVEDLRRPAIQPVSQFLDGLHVAACSLFDVRPCDLAQLLQVYAFAHVGEFEAQRFAISLIALLAAGIFSVVVRGHFCLSKSLVSREISEVSSCFTPSPGRCGLVALRWCTAQSSPADHATAHPNAEPKRCR